MRRGGENRQRSSRWRTVAGALLPLLLCLLIFTGESEALALPRILGDGMVLQRNQVNRIWGTSSAPPVTVRFLGETYTSGTDALGRWNVSLPAQESGGPYDITIEDRAARVVLRQVLLGDVYLCTGQSNMEISLADVMDAPRELKRAHYAGIRIIRLGTQLELTPQEDIRPWREDGWVQVNPHTLGGPPGDEGMAQSFSALCYLFGREVHEDFGRTMPIGLIESAFPSDMEMMVPPEVFDRCHNLEKARDFGPRSSMWNGMLWPLRHLSLAGVVVYHGETGTLNPEGYRCLFPEFIRSVRTYFAQPALPVLFVQIAPFDGPFRIAELRLAQESALVLPDVYMTTAADLGDRDGPTGTIHPRRKQEVAARLAQLALEHLYGRAPPGSSDCPQVRQVVVVEEAAAQVSVLVQFDGVYGGLQLASSPSPPASTEPPFELRVRSAAGELYSVVDPVLSLHGVDTVRLTATLRDPADQVVSVLYAMTAWPACVVYDGARLPALPFEWRLS